MTDNFDDYVDYDDVYYDWDLSEETFDALSEAAESSLELLDDVIDDLVYINVTENLDYDDMIDSYCERYQDVSQLLKGFGIFVQLINEGVYDEGSTIVQGQSWLR